MMVLCWIQSMTCPGIKILLLFFCVQLFLKCYILFTIYSGTILSTSIYSTQSIHNYLTWSMQFLGRKKCLFELKLLFLPSCMLLYMVCIWLALSSMITNLSLYLEMQNICLIKKEMHNICLINNEIHNICCLVI